MTQGTEIEKRFKRLFSVTKDLHSIRKKGVIQEEIVEAIGKKYKINKSIVSKTEDISFSIYGTTGISTNSTKTVGLYYYRLTMGIPTFKIGVKNKEKWEEIREYLRKKKLVR